MIKLSLANNKLSDLSTKVDNYFATLKSRHDSKNPHNEYLRLLKYQKVDKIIYTLQQETRLSNFLTLTPSPSNLNKSYLSQWIKWKPNWYLQNLLSHPFLFSPVFSSCYVGERCPLPSQVVPEYLFNFLPLKLVKSYCCRFSSAAPVSIICPCGETSCSSSGEAQPMIGSYASVTRVPKFWHRYYINLLNIWRRCIAYKHLLLLVSIFTVAKERVLLWILCIHHSSINVKIKIGEPYWPLTRLGTLEHLKSLISLDLGANMITQLEDNTFIGNRMLQHLRLDSNQVVNVSEYQVFCCHLRLFHFLG